MSAYRETTIAGVSNNTMLAFRHAAKDRRAKVVDVINWSIQLLAIPPRLCNLYWITDEGTKDEKVTKIDIKPMPPMPQVGGSAEQKINLIPDTVQALARARKRYNCDAAGVLARAAWLATYFGRADGKLGYGQYAKTRNGYGITAIQMFST